MSDDASDSDDSSITGPAYSLITDAELSDRELSDNEMEESLDDIVTDNELDVSSEQASIRVTPFHKDNYVASMYMLVYLIILQSVEESQTDEEEFDHKYIIDNIDKNVKPSFERHEHKGQSLHYVHGYAVKCRVSRFGLSNEPPSTNNNTPNIDLMLPSILDVQALRDDCIILVTR